MIHSVVNLGGHCETGWWPRWHCMTRYRGRLIRSLNWNRSRDRLTALSAFSSAFRQRRTLGPGADGVGLAITSVLIRPLTPWGAEIGRIPASWREPRASVPRRRRTLGRSKLCAPQDRRRRHRAFGYRVTTVYTPFVRSQRPPSVLIRCSPSGRQHCWAHWPRFPAHRGWLRADGRRSSPRDHSRTVRPVRPGLDAGSSSGPFHLNA